MWKKLRQNYKQAKLKSFLITINVLGSTGPLRLFVHEEDLVADVIDVALKKYAREDRLPMIESSDVDDFFLYCIVPEYNALCSSEKIGAYGARMFVLCRKHPPGAPRTDKRQVRTSNGCEGTVTCKKWFKKSISFKF